MLQQSSSSACIRLRKSDRDLADRGRDTETESARRIRHRALNSLFPDLVQTGAGGDNVPASCLSIWPSREYYPWIHQSEGDHSSSGSSRAGCRSRNQPATRNLRPPRELCEAPKVSSLSR